MQERDDIKHLSGNIKIDDVYWGGDKHGGKRVGCSRKTHFVAAVQTNDEAQPIAI